MQVCTLLYLREAGGDIQRTIALPQLVGSDQLANRQTGTRAVSERTSFPSFAELRQLAGDELKLVQQAVGGDYAYNLGVAEGGSPQAPKCQGRSQFAIYADAPVMLGSNSDHAREEAASSSLLTKGRGSIFSSRMGTCVL